MKFFITLILFAIPSLAAKPLPAVDPNNLCLVAESIVNNYSLRTGKIGADCFVLLRTNPNNGDDYVEYLWSTDGGLLITVTYGHGALSKTMAYIVRYYLPLSQNLSLSLEDKFVVIQTPNGTRFTFDTIKQMYSENDDGLDLYKIEMPYTVGHTPKDDIYAEVNVSFAGTKCTPLSDGKSPVLALHLFRYQGEDPLLYVRTSGDLISMINKKCPNIAPIELTNQSENNP